MTLCEKEPDNTNSDIRINIRITYYYFCGATDTLNLRVGVTDVFLCLLVYISLS